MAEKMLGSKEQPLLNVLRSFRDSRMSNSGNLVALYYEHSNEAAAILSANPKMKAMFRNIIFEMIPVIKAGLDNNRPAKITNAQYRKITNLMKSISAVSTPGLRNSLNAALKDMETGKLLKDLNITVVKK